MDHAFFFTAKSVNGRMQPETTFLFVWVDVYNSKWLINSIIDALINSWGVRFTWFDCDAHSTTRNLSVMILSLSLLWTQ